MPEIAKQPDIYQIRVQGKLDPNWSSWFDGWSVTLESEHPPITSLSGEVIDQASLRGVLNKLWDLNLVLIAVHRSLK